MPNEIIETYDYDEIGQLRFISQTNKGVTEILNEFVYDKMGNMLTQTNTPSPNLPMTLTVSEYNDLNQLTAKAERAIDGTILSRFKYEHDKRGNLIKEIDTINGTEQSYTFDARNRIVSGTNHSGETSTYEYNALNILTRHNDTAFVVDYSSAIPKNLMEYSNDNIITRHVYGNNLSRVSTTLTNAVNLTQIETFYIQSDHLGTGRFTTDATGARVGHTTLDAWGNIIEKNLPTFNGKHVDILNTFTNYQHDPVLNLYISPSRFYDPSNARFISPDAKWTAYNRIENLHAIQQAGNLYAYVLNNPLKYTDPTGLSFVHESTESIRARYEAQQSLRAHTSTRNVTHQQIEQTLRTANEYFSQFDCEDIRNMLSPFINQAESAYALALQLWETPDKIPLKYLNLHDLNALELAQIAVEAASIYANYMVPPSTFAPNGMWSIKDLRLLVQFENGNTITWDGATPALLEAKNNFEAALDERGWTIDYTSVVRPLIYQAHFYDIGNANGSRYDTDEGRADARAHGLSSIVGRPSSTSAHVAGIAFDARVYNENGVALNSMTSVNAELARIANANGLNVNIPNDLVHFQIR
jgi:RHS repeat-associated protein